MSRVAVARAAPRSAEPVPALTRRGDAHERDADRVADAVMARPARPVSGAAPLLARPVAAVPARGGQPLPTAARTYLEPRFGRSLDGVRVHDGAGAATAAGRLGARAFTLGADIHFARGALDPASEGGMHLLAHEVAHTLQPGAAGRIARKTLTDIPEATRKGLKVSRAGPDQATVDGWLAGYFNPADAGTANPAATVEFGGTIPAALQRGFTGAAHDLAATISLPIGSILDIAIDLTTRGGPNAIFRFTRYMDGKDEKILIEQTVQIAPAPAATASTGTAPPAGSAAPQGAAPAAATGTVAVGAIKVEIDSRFGADRGQQIVDALKQLPAPILAKADGVTFNWEGAGNGPGDEAGEYKPEKDTIRVWGAMFDARTRRVGTATEAQAGILHEVGHLIDLRPEFKAQIARGKAQEKKQKLEGELNNPKIDLNDKDPLAGLDDDKSPARVEEKRKLKAAIDEAQKEIDTQNTAMATAKSLTGDEANESSDTEKLIGDFGKALISDGVTSVANANKTNDQIDTDNKAIVAANKAKPDAPPKPTKDHVKTLAGDVTDYADTNLREAFAENFSYYILDEALLKAIRPNTHAFFVKALPKAPAAATAPPGQGPKP